MAEVLGAVASGLTIAAVFKGCILAFDLLHHARHQDEDLQKLTLRFNIERCRLYVWGEAMGLTTPSIPIQNRPLESSQFQDLVCDTLQALLDIFQNTQKMTHRYGCREVSVIHDRNHPFQPESSDLVRNLAASFSNFSVMRGTRDKVKNLALQTRWVIHDRKKFAELITEAKTLIDGLQEITKSLCTVARQEGMIRYGIQKIKDVDTLQLVADVSQKDYPDMSDAASIKVDILTLATNQKLAIEDWAQQVDIDPDDEILDIESMTVTELKHRLWSTVSKLPSNDAQRLLSLIDKPILETLTLFHVYVVCMNYIGKDGRLGVLKQWVVLCLLALPFIYNIVGLGHYALLLVVSRIVLGLGWSGFNDIFCDIRGCWRRGEYINAFKIL